MLHAAIEDSCAKQAIEEAWKNSKASNLKLKHDALESMVPADNIKVPQTKEINHFDEPSDLLKMADIEEKSDNDKSSAFENFKLSKQS